MTLFLVGLGVGLAVGGFGVGYYYSRIVSELKTVQQAGSILKKGL